MGGHEPTSRMGDDRARRIAALRGLAGQTPGTPAGDGARATRPTRAPRRALLAALVAVVLVAGGVGVYLHSRPAGKPSTTAIPAIPATLTLNAGTGQVGCPSSIAWSPDGGRLAVLAMKGNCAANEPVGLIFDTRTGKPLITLDLASALTAQHLGGAVTSVTWSPDGTSVLFGALVGSSTPTQFPTVEPALLIFAADDTSARVLTGKSIPQANSALTGVIWDISARQEVQAITSALPPAPSYRWTSDGQLAAAQPPANTTTDSALAPSSDGTFSAWQPGTFVPIMAWDSAHDNVDFNAPPIAQGYLAITNLWSPDGRYLAMGLHTQHLMPPAPGQSLPALNPNACNTAGFFPPRNGCPKQATPLPDATFASIAHLARIGTHFHDTKGNTGLFWSPVPVAWRADGTRLATILPDDGFNSGNQEYVVSIFQIGQTEPAARLSLGCPGMPCRFQWQPGNAGLAWSPAGTQLALLDPDSGLITIWGGKMLPS